ncbi:MAG: endonuclease MutS2 [Bacillota bacterium]|nr:endonuclease MutS2 [Bacillota bacterium]
MDERALRVLEFDKIVQMVKNLASSDLGKEIAEKLIPENSYGKVEILLKETSDAASFIARKGRPPLGGIHDIHDSIRRASLGGTLNPGELLRISDVLMACRNLKGYASEGVNLDGENCVNELIKLLEPNRRIEDKIRQVILSEEEISDTASTTLSNIRRQIRQLQDSIKERLNSIVRSSKYQKYMQDAIVTMRGDRYVVPVKQEYRNEIQGLVHDSSSSGATLFIEPLAVVEANNDIRQLKIKEQLEIERILQELTADVSGIIDKLESNVGILAKLDFVFAKARLSLDYNCVCPRMNNNGRIVIKKGRHPLIEKHSVVPINFWIGEGFDTLVITGPNTGGKTVTLKTVGLFTLMTQAGLHVPAGEGTEMSVFNKVFADIGDEQSIEQSLSTFSSHMKNIVEILKEADDRSLILFDELGAGTDPTEGAALAMSVLERLHDTGARTVATTHYSELKVYAITTGGVENACCEFDVETLRPTYKLLIGIPGKSNAFAISSRLGLSDMILDRAKEFLSQEDIRFEDVLMSIEKNRDAAEQEKLKAEKYRLDAENIRKQMEDEKRRFEQQKEKILREAREESRRILLDAKSESENILAEIRRLEMEAEAAERNRAAEEIKQRLRSKINKLEDSLTQSALPKQGFAKPPENLKPGDTVVIINLNQKGTVLTPPDKNGEALIQAGIMKINVHVSNLRRVDEQRAELHKTGAGKIGVSKAGTISTEIDLRGMTLDEAIEIVDKYIDDAAIAGLHEVMIIHGKGTGALRSGIHKYLKSNHSVKSFRLGKYGEGEAGVTVTELK